MPYLLTRGALLASALLAPLFAPRAPGSGIWDPTAFDWLNAWTRWDGLEYLLIVHEGYSYTPGVQSNIAFAPLYPLLMKLGEMLVPGSGYLATVLTGLLVSNACLFGALILLHRLVAEDADLPTASRTVLYVLVFPTSFFLSALYPESLFMVCAIGAFYLARRQRWWLAGLLGFLGVLTRQYGLMLMVPLAFEYLSQRHWRWREVRADIAALALLPLAYAAWLGYLAQLTGDPRAVFMAQDTWDRRLALPWQSFVSFFSEPLQGHGSLHSPLDLGFALLFLALVALSWRRVRATYALYASLLYLLLISSGPLVSQMRYGLELFPAFAVLAHSGRFPLFHRAFVACSFLFGLRLMSLFAQGYWVA